MGSGAGFHELDVEAARLFGQVAREAGVRRIVYLGGLGNPKADLSQHLRSRQETGRALREGRVPVAEFRAAVIVGSGSISFEMIRYLVERLPVMVCPRWVYSRVQPIAVNDVLDYPSYGLLLTQTFAGHTRTYWPCGRHPERCCSGDLMRFPAIRGTIDRRILAKFCRYKARFESVS